MTDKINTDALVRVNNPNSDLFTDRLKATIKRLRGVAKAARIAGVAESTMRKRRDGNSEPQRPYLIPLAKEAGFNIAWLVANEGPMHRLTQTQKKIAVELNAYSLRRNVAGQQACMFFMNDYNQRKLGLPDDFYDEIPHVEQDDLTLWRNTLYEEDFDSVKAADEFMSNQYRRSPDFNIDSLRQAVEMIETVLNEKSLYLQPDKKADLVSLVYEMLEESEEGVEKSRILKLIGLAA